MGRHALPDEDKKKTIWLGIWVKDMNRLGGEAAMKEFLLKKLEEGRE